MGGRRDGSGRQGQRAAARRRGAPAVVLLAVALGLPLSGCGWLFGSDQPSDAGKARPGVDRKAPVTGALPAASGQHDASIVAVDPVGAGQIGAIVPAKGGQKAQKEAAEKEAAERDAKEREERQKREAAEREAREAEKQEPSAPRATPEVGTVPPKPSAATRGNDGPETPVKAQPESSPAVPSPAVPPPGEAPAPPRS